MLNWTVAGLMALVTLAAGAGTEAKVKIRVACIGDSITWGYAMTNRVEECYPAQLQRLLGTDYEVRNFGDPGSGVYSKPKADSFGWVEHPWRTDKSVAAVLAFSPDIIVSNLGINDSGTYLCEFIHDADGHALTETGLFRREYISLLREFSQAGRSPRIVMWTRLGPLGKRHRAKGTPNAFVMERDLEAVASAVGAETLDMYTPLVPYAETAHFAADGVHPEGGACAVIARETARQILKGKVEKDLVGRDDGIEKAASLN